MVLAAGGGAALGVQTNRKPLEIRGLNRSPSGPGPNHAKPALRKPLA